MSTGKTVGKYTKFQMGDSGNTLRDIPVATFGNVGLVYTEVDLTSLQDAITNALNGQGTFSTTITGPFDNRATVAASTTGQRPALSGSHTILAPLNGLQVARSFGIYVGIQADWASGDPVFGAAACILISQYTFSPENGTYSAKITVASSRTNDPAWGTAQIS